MLAEAESFLNLLESPQRLLLTGALGSPLGLLAEGFVRVLDSMPLSITLDL